MEISAIKSLWEEDSKIDNTNLHNDSINIARLHSKYYNIFIEERITLIKHQTKMKKLKRDKLEFFSQGPNEETQKKGWQYPAAKGLILKAEIPIYMDADDDMIELTIKIEIQQEKVEFLRSIITTFKN